jgi:uncharacterized protein YozE (UPF0346 family)
MTSNFISALQSLPQFIQEMDADWSMVSNWMEDQCGFLTDAQWDEVSEIFTEYLEDLSY